MYYIVKDVASLITMSSGKRRLAGPTFPNTSVQNTSIRPLDIFYIFAGTS